jgi:hypothetical protein
VNNEPNKRHKRLSDGFVGLVEELSKFTKLSTKIEAVKIEQLCCTQALAHIGEYAQTICALALNTLASPINETTRVLCLPHPFIKVDFLPFVNDFHLEMEVIFDQKTLIFTLVCSPHFSFDGPLDMVYELL